MMKKDELSTAVWGLAQLVDRLCGPDGCPWDTKQTPATIKMYLLEDKELVTPHIGHKVVVAGTLQDDGKTIKVRSIKMVDGI